MCLSFPCDPISGTVPTHWTFCSYSWSWLSPTRVCVCLDSLVNCRSPLDSYQLVMWGRKQNFSQVAGKANSFMLRPLRSFRECRKFLKHGIGTLLTSFKKAAIPFVQRNSLLEFLLIKGLKWEHLWNVARNQFKLALIQFLPGYSPSQPRVTIEESKVQRHEEWILLRESSSFFF